MPGYHKRLTAEVVLKRMKNLKKEIDKGKTSNVTKTGCSILKSPRLTQAVMSKGATFRGKDGFVRWNGLDVNIDTANAVLTTYKELRDKYKTPNKISKNKPKKATKDHSEPYDDKFFNKLQKELQQSFGNKDNNAINAEAIAMLADVKSDIAIIKSTLVDLGYYYKQLVEKGMDGILNTERMLG